MRMTELSQERPDLWTGHVVLYSRDPVGCGLFYERLGMRAIASTEAFAVLELRGGTHLVIRHDPGAQGGPAPFDLMVEDLDETWEKWRAGGITVSGVGQDERGIHRVFTVTDPDQNTLVVNDSHVVGVV